MIPKIIWQTHECDYDNLTNLYKSNSQTWKDAFSDWEYKYHSSIDRDRFVEEFFPQYLPIFRHIKHGIYKADFWRHLVLYQFGGLYADMDSIYTGPETVFSNCLTVSTNTYGFPDDQPYSNAWIVSYPKNEVLKMVIDEMVKRINNYKFIEQEDPGIKWVLATGPSMYSYIINQNKDYVNLLHFPVWHAGDYKHESDKK
jgi:mannosyltransferase OCH1-like enzyme